MPAIPDLVKFRLVLGLFLVGLVLSGVTAFPLLSELRILSQALGLQDAHSVDGFTGWARWILTVRFGLEATYASYPWIAYGTDWLAFGHLMIALFFVDPWLHPERARPNLVIGIIACALVFPLAAICGPLRGIPFWWRLIDCSFGLFGALPLLYCLRLSRRIPSVP